MLFLLLLPLSEFLLAYSEDPGGKSQGFAYDGDYNSDAPHSPEECLYDSYGGFHYKRDQTTDYGSYHRGTHPYYFRRRFHHAHGNHGDYFPNKRRLNRSDHDYHHHHHHHHHHPHHHGKYHHHHPHHHHHHYHHHNYPHDYDHEHRRRDFHQKKKETLPVSPSTTSKPAVPDCGRNYEAKIIGGKATDARNWRWMASIMRRPNEHMCGGSLISIRYVLTAAHCIDGVRISTTHVRLGEHDFSREDDGSPEDYAIDKLIKHPRYDRVGYKNDVGMIKLERPAFLSPSINTICLPKSVQNYAGKEAIVVGWGLVSYGGSNSNTLRRVSVVIWNNTECSKAYSFSVPFQPYYMCAGSIDGQDSCSGDSGGPLMVQNGRRWTVIGIVSWGFRCGEPNFPGVYARIDHFLRWIKRNLLQ